MFDDLTARDLTELIRAIDDRVETAAGTDARASLVRSRRAVVRELGRRLTAVNELAELYGAPAHRPRPVAA